MATVYRRYDKNGRVYYINVDTNKQTDYRAWRISITARKKAKFKSNIDSKRKERLIDAGIIDKADIESFKLEDVRLKKAKDYKPRYYEDGWTRIRWGFVGHGETMSEERISGAEAIHNVLSVHDIVRKADFNLPANLSFFTKFMDFIIDGGLSIHWYRRGVKKKVGTPLRPPVYLTWPKNRGEILYLVSLR